MSAEQNIANSMRRCATLGRPACAERCPYRNEPDCVNVMLRDGADAIDELREDRDAAYLAGHQIADKLPTWISVEERLPGDNEFVLCFSGQRYMVVASTQVFETFKITHWMPLPNPPARAIDK